MRVLGSLLFVLLLSLPVVRTVHGEDSAQDIASLLERKLNAGAAVQMKFTVKDAGSFRILVDVHASRVRIETAVLTIVTDGKTVWNFNKKTNQLTIDHISNNQNSALASARDLFRFSTNYTIEEVAHQGSSHTLKLTPNEHVRAALKSLGDVQSLTIVVRKKGSSVTIRRARLDRSGATNAVSSLSVTSVKSVSQSDFLFSPPKGAKVVDLRE